MNMKQYMIEEIFSRFGAVKRARDCFLYTSKGVRLVDMYQEGGRAILGWGKGSAVTVFKNVLERKIIGTFATDFSPRVSGGQSQLSRAVSELLAGERFVHIFNSRNDALDFAKSNSLCAVDFIPWNQENIDWREKDCVLIAPPFPFGDTVFVIAMKEDVPGGDSVYCVPAPLSAAITRSIYDLISELQTREEKDWFIYDTVLTKYWMRKGPYLFPKVGQERYKDFIVHCLDCGIVISPDFNVPSIVPFGADKGNFTKLKNNPFEF